jgi:hypothetical protein
MRKFPTPRAFYIYIYLTQPNLPYPTLPYPTHAGDDVYFFVFNFFLYFFYFSKMIMIIFLYFIRLG